MYIRAKTSLFVLPCLIRRANSFLWRGFAIETPFLDMRSQLDLELESFHFLSLINFGLGVVFSSLIEKEVKNKQITPDRTKFKALVPFLNFSENEFPLSQLQ